MQGESKFCMCLGYRIPAAVVFMLVWVVSYLVLSKVSSETRSLSAADQMQLSRWAVALASRGVTEVVMATFAIVALLLRRWPRNHRDAATWCLTGLLLVFTALSCFFQINSVIRAFSFSF